MQAVDTYGGNSNLHEKLKKALGTLDPELRAILESSYGLSGSIAGDEEQVTAPAAAAEPLGSADAALEEIALRALYSSPKKQ